MLAYIKIINKHTDRSVYCTMMAVETGHIGNEAQCITNDKGGNVCPSKYKAISAKSL